MKKLTSATKEFWSGDNVTVTLYMDALGSKFVMTFLISSDITLAVKLVAGSNNNADIFEPTEG